MGLLIAYSRPATREKGNKMSKYIISEAALKAAKAIADKAIKAWSTLDQKAKDAIIGRAVETAQKVGGAPFYHEGPPLLFIAEDEEGRALCAVSTPTLPQVLRLGAGRIYDETGKGLVIFGKNPWLLPNDYSQDNAPARDAADALYKGFNPARVAKEDWDAYMAPIRDLALKERGVRVQIAEAEETGNLSVILGLKEEAGKLREERLRLNCLGLAKFLAYSERYGNVPPFSHDGTEEGKARACMGLRVKDFQAWRDAHLEEARSIALARLEGLEYEETPQEKADRFLSADGEKRSKAAEDAAAEKAAMKGDEPHQLAFAGILNAMFAARGWGHVLRLDAENAEAADCRGWGKLVRATLLPDGKAASNAIKRNPQLWGDYLLKADGTPQNLWGLFFKTYHLLGEGMSFEGYAACCGVPKSQVYDFLAWVAKQEAKKREAAETVKLFAANRAWRAQSQKILVDEDDAV